MRSSNVLFCQLPWAVASASLLTPASETSIRKGGLENARRAMTVRSDSRPRRTWLLHLAINEKVLRVHVDPTRYRQPQPQMVDCMQLCAGEESKQECRSTALGPARAEVGGVG